MNFKSTYAPHLVTPFCLLIQVLLISSSWAAKPTCESLNIKVAVFRHGHGQHMEHGIRISKPKTTYPFNGKENPATGAYLTQKGRIEIQQAAHDLKFSLAGKNFDPTSIAAIYSSPLHRTQETAKILKDGLGAQAHIQTSDLIIERDFGLAEGLPIKDSPFRIPADATPERAQQIKEMRSSAEGDAQIMERAKKFVKELRKTHCTPKFRNKTIVIATHDIVADQLNKILKTSNNHMETGQFTISRLKLAPEPPELDKHGYKTGGKRKRENRIAAAEYSKQELKRKKDAANIAQRAAIRTKHESVLEEFKKTTPLIDAPEGKDPVQKPQHQEAGKKIKTSQMLKLTEETKPSSTTPTKRHSLVPAH